MCVDKDTLQIYMHQYKYVTHLLSNGLSYHIATYVYRTTSWSILYIHNSKVSIIVHVKVS